MYSWLYVRPVALMSPSPLISATARFESRIRTR